MAAGINGGLAAWILGASAWRILHQVTALWSRARRNRMHTNVRDRAPAPNTGSACGGMSVEHPEGRESRARTARREQSAPRPPEPQATTHIEQLNTQEMVPTSRPTVASLRRERPCATTSVLVYSPLYILCHTLPLNLTNKMLMLVIKII